MAISKRNRPLIFVDFGSSHEKLPFIVKIARERDWKLQWHDYHLGGSLIPDGALIQSLPDSALAEKLRKMGCPTVRLGNYVHVDDNRLPAVLPDLTAAGRLAAEHYAKRQYTEVGFVGFAVEKPDTDLNPLYEEFRRAAEDLGMACSYHSTSYEGAVDDPPDVRQRKKARAYLDLVKRIPKPIGVLTTIDAAAWAICETCLNHGIGVPEDVAMLSYGNALTTEMTPISISSIDPGHEEICRQGMDLLQNLMDGAPSSESPIYVPPSRIVDRESTDVLASSDPVVRKALRFMWEHLDQDLTVDDVVLATGVSHSTLHRKLKREIGHSVIAELRRKRLERACELLRGSDLNISEVAAKIGFATRNYLHRVFHEEFGMTPVEYRKQNAV